MVSDPATEIEPLIPASKLVGNDFRIEQGLYLRLGRKGQRESDAEGDDGPIENFVKILKELHGYSVWLDRSSI